MFVLIFFYLNYFTWTWIGWLYTKNSFPKVHHVVFCSCCHVANGWAPEVLHLSLLSTHHSHLLTSASSPIHNSSSTAAMSQTPNVEKLRRLLRAAVIDHQRETLESKMWKEEIKVAYMGLVLLYTLNCIIFFVLSVMLRCTGCYITNHSFPIYKKKNKLTDSMHRNVVCVLSLQR